MCCQQQQEVASSVGKSRKRRDLEENHSWVDLCPCGLAELTVEALEPIKQLVPSHLHLPSIPQAGNVPALTRIAYSPANPRLYCPNGSQATSPKAEETPWPGCTCLPCPDSPVILYSFLCLLSKPMPSELFWYPVNWFETCKCSVRE